MPENRNGGPAGRGRGQKNKKGGARPQQQASAPPAPKPPGPANQRVATVSRRHKNDVTIYNYGVGDQTLTTALEKFAASFVTAGEARVLPTPTPNFANAMAFHKILPVAGDTGLFSGVFNRMFILDPYRPWTEGITVIEERSYSGTVILAEGAEENGKNFTIVPNISIPVSMSGLDADGNQVSIAAELREIPGSGIKAWNPVTGRLEDDKHWMIPSIRFQTVGVNATDNLVTAIVSDQTQAQGTLLPQYFDVDNGVWVNLPGTTANTTFSGAHTTFTSNPGANSGNFVDGAFRCILNCTNTHDLGTIRGFSTQLKLSNVTNAHLATVQLPLCATADRDEVISVWDRSSHVRFGGLAFWLECTAAGLTNGGSVLAAQVLKSTHFSKIPSIAFTQLSELPDRCHVGKFREGAYGWYNPDRVLDLEFKPPNVFQTSVSESASVMVVIVRPENLGGAGQSYLFKVNSNYNYRWQSRIFKPILTPCSWELLQRLLVVNAAYCNVGCNPNHVDKIRALCKDFASNPENRRIAADVFRLMKPGLKGLANGIGETFIPGYNILKGAIDPYL